MKFSLTLRQERALRALLTGPRTTLQLRNIIGCINVADVILRLRRRGLTIPRVDVRVNDRDDKTCIVGLYSLTARDVMRVQEWLGV